MKYLIAILYIFIFTSNGSALNENIQDTIRGSGIQIDWFDPIFECLRLVLKDGIPGFLPSFNPLKLGDLPLNLDEIYPELLEGYFNFKNAALNGVQNFNVTEFELFVIPLGKIGYSVDIDLSLFGQYDADSIMFGFVPVDGVGDFNLNLKTTLSGKFVAALTDKGIKLEEFYVFIKVIPNIKFLGLKNDERQSHIISKQLDVIVDDLVNNNVETISSTISPIIKNTIQELLEWTQENIIIDEIKEICPNAESYKKLVIDLITKKPFNL